MKGLIKKSLYSLTILSFLLFFVLPNTSCKKGEGCPNETEYAAPDLSSKKASKRGKSSLFGSKAKKKKRK